MRIAVASGKGGTGKTTIATSLALSIAGGDQADDSEVAGPISRLLFLDCDVEAPNAHLFLNPHFRERVEVGLLVPEVDESLCTYCRRCAEVCEYNAIAVAEECVLIFPELCHGCGSCTLNCPEGAISEVPRVMGVLEAGPTPHGFQFARGLMNVGEAMAVPIIRALKKWDMGLDGENTQVEEGSVFWETIIVDVPPGTTCPVVEAVRGADFALLVTEPTPFGLHDLRLMVEVVSELGIPAGVVINRDGTGYEEMERFCKEADLPVMLRIPLEQRIAEGTARRKPLIFICPEYEKYLREMYERIIEIVKGAVR
ncbi:MAG: ATP-binding protein [Candidatus Latescibacteria bacterium]|nr:ATP-binding protein [Candidatus Latescibacterota bacterium]